jgi:hemoglobin-like flavoprotein
MINYETLFNDSYTRVTNSKKVGEDFYGDFYDAFLSSSPEIALKFKDTDMEKQKTMLRESFLYMLAFFCNFQANGYLISLAYKHSKLGYQIVPYMYNIWLQCLVDTVRRFDPMFCDDVELAWRVVMAPGIAFMKSCVP